MTYSRSDLEEMWKTKDFYLNLVEDQKEILDKQLRNLWEYTQRKLKESSS